MAQDKDGIYAPMDYIVPDSTESWDQLHDPNWRPPDPIEDDGTITYID